MKTENEAGATSFDALLADINAAGDDLAKSTAAAEEDARIEAAAAEAADADPDDGDEDGAAGPGENLGKSMKAVDAEGNEMEAIDATDLIKSLIGQVGSIEAKTVEVLGAMATQLKAQGDLIKSLTGEMRAMGSQGRGRRSVLTIQDKGGELAKSLTAGAEPEADEPKGLNGREFLAKALKAAEEGKIGYSDAAYCETMVNRGQQPPAHIVQAVMG